MKYFFSTIFVLAFVVIVALALKKQSLTSPKTEDSNLAEIPAPKAKNLLPPSAISTSKPNSTAMQTSVENETALKKVHLLKEIIDSKNDNDPRLDTEFQNLSETSKALMRQEYNSMKPEKFNQKGTVVFLLGRNLKTQEDFKFLGSVLSEPPCENISDCSKPSEKLEGDAVHEVSADGVTLVYPQIVSLKALEPFIVTPPADLALREVIINDFQIAAASKNMTLARMGRNYLNRFMAAGQNP